MEFHHVTLFILMVIGILAKEFERSCKIVNDVVLAKELEMKKVLVDHLGIGVSMLCLVHCLLLPVLLIFFPAIKSMTTGIDAHFHEALYFIILAISLVSFIPTYLKSKRVFFMINPAIALVLMSIAHFGEELGYWGISTWPEIILTSSGGLFLIYTHYHNIKYCRTCKTKHHTITP